ncbi:MAG: hypothetical protein V5A55_11635 [Halovenus sp.]
MTDARDPLAGFDPETIQAVAEDHDVDPERLETIARDHQNGVRSLPGVEDIVYEWRTQFHEDPLLSRSDRAYVLALRDHVWDEFVESLALSEAEVTALRALHERVADTLLDGDAATEGAMVLVRP